ncbi:MAG: membrane protein insertion efficiency factor YidD [FCB group bacterium]|nr:membrane protein insertion efficiency factor YidD [FCB group bacterium]
MRSSVRHIFIALVKLYQNTLGLLLPPSCRYSPSCSEYTIQAISKYGALKGSWFGFLRIMRCHPYATRDHFDPVK